MSGWSLKKGNYQSHSNKTLAEYFDSDASSYSLTKTMILMIMVS